MSFLGCAQVGDALYSNGIKDMFEVFKPNKTKIIEGCEKNTELFRIQKMLN
jgi:hypothetical protein